MSPEEEFEKMKKRLTKAIEKKLASIQKAIQNANRDLVKSHEFEKVQHYAELVKTNFAKLRRGMQKITVADWQQENSEVTIALDPTITPQEQLEDLFKKSQKLKRALMPLKALVNKLKHEIRLWESAKINIDAMKELEALKKLETELNLVKKAPAPAHKEKVVKSAPYHTFFSESGHEILVGKSAKNNDILTFQIAHGSDLWLHAHAKSGSHVVIRRKGGKDVDPETIQDALQLALYHSKARSDLASEHDVLLTERKYVSRLPRTPKGQVVVSKHKTLNCSIDKERLGKIKSRKKVVAEKK
jgi:predicted ribosome quality control (RQC) complex YloA/Tae2 family protein